MFTLHSLTHTGSLNNHVPLVFGKSKHDCDHDFSHWCVVRNAHVENVDLDTSFYQVTNQHGSFGSSTGKAVEFTHHQFVTGFQLREDFIELRPVDLRASVGVQQDMLLVDTLSQQLFKLTQSPGAMSQGFLLRSRSQMSALPISARVSSPPGRSSPLSKNYANDTPTHIKQRAGTRSFLLF